MLKIFLLLLGKVKKCIAEKKTENIVVVLALASTMTHCAPLRFSIGCFCTDVAASITGLETVLINPRANAALRLFCSICILHPGAFGGCLL